VGTPWGHGMRAYLLRRLAQLVPVAIGVTLVAFILTRLTGDPAVVLLPPEATVADRAVFRAAYGLDRPLPVQYLLYLANLLHGDFGTSFGYGEPALRVVLNRFPATFELSVAAMILVVIVGIPAGLLSASWRGTVLDRIARGGILLGQSIATFWLGLMLILIFAVRLRLFPPSGWEGMSSLVLPAVTLALYLTALVARLTRSGMLEVLSADFLRTARAKGVRESTVLWRHAFSNALLPVVTVLGIQFGSLLAGAVVTETVFSWPGVGSLVVDALSRRDYPVIQAAVLVFALTYALINLTVDLLYAYLDPRIRYR